MECGDDWKWGPVFIPGTRYKYRSPFPVISKTPYPAFEDGTDRWFRNVGIQKSDAGDTPKRLLTICKTRRKFEIKKILLSVFW
jgi:hypothetical protein